MPSLAETKAGHVEPPVREAACLILVDRSNTEPRLLMGRRLPTQAFLPNKWVFPGGRVDDADHAITKVAATSMKLSPAAAGHLPYAYAAVRETFEESGVLVAAAEAQEGPQTALADLFIPSAINLLKPLARAITPPGRPRRFDTWFYLAEWNCNHLPAGTPDGELLDIGWFTIPQVLNLDLPVITRLIVDDVATKISSPPSAEALLIPFYFQAVEGYRRALISPAWPWPGADSQP
jgi:8-oxo-dGTP pyrophosphatase MutT (NUDIX family)